MQEANIIIFIVVAILLLLTLVISIILFFNFSQKRILAEKELNHQQKMNFQKEMLESTINIQEEERGRIARELHDDISSKLNVINMNMNILKMKLEKEENKKLVANISSSLRHSIDRSRNISHELMPPILEKFGLEEAILDHAQQINYTGELKMEIRGKQNFSTVLGQKKLHIFRIIQELCNNNLKHAEASNILLECNSSEVGIDFTYHDDGIGVDQNTVSKGIGTMNIETRVQILNATWEYIPVKKGVTFKFTIPNAKQTYLN